MRLHIFKQVVVHALGLQSIYNKNILQRVEQLITRHRCFYG